jgi:hypothetical protein
MENYNYNFEINNILVILALVAYAIFNSNNPYINSIITALYSLNYTTIFLISSIILTYLIIAFLKFEINFSFTIKFNK